MFDITGIAYEGILDDEIKINKERLEINDDLFVGTIDANPHRSIWTSDGWKHNAGEEIQDSGVEFRKDFELPILSRKSVKEAVINVRPNSVDVPAYTEHKKIFELICNLAQTPAQRMELTAGLDFLHYRMREMAINTSAGNISGKINDDAEDSMTEDTPSEKEEMMSETKHGLKSFTAISKQVKCIRLRAPYSPLRRNRKKTT